MGSEAHPQLNTEMLDFRSHMLLRMAQATSAVREGLRVNDIRGEFDSRMVRLDLRGLNTPRYRFLLDKALFREISGLRYDYGPEQLGQDLLLSAALAETKNAVRPDFSFGAINDINQTYFQSPVAFDPSAGLARMFTHNLAVNAAIGALVGEHLAEKDEARIKELCCGPNTSHWRLRSETVRAFNIGRVALTVCDLEPPALPDPPIAKASVRAERYSLFDDLPELPPGERYDAMVTTYGFDSVWQPEDMRVWRCGDQWFRAAYRIKVADWHPRGQELLHALRTGRALPGATATDYEGIFVEEAWLPIAATDIPYAGFLCGRSTNRPTNVPGGMIKRIAQAFQGQLQPHGIFVSGDVIDVATTGEWGNLASDVSGVAERFKVEDYLLAARVLEKNYGLRAEYRPIVALMDEYISEWEDNMTPQVASELKRDVGTGVLVVTRPA